MLLNFRARALAVGSIKKPNSWGAYNFHGNVLEWCSDSYTKYPSGFVINPEVDLGISSDRVFRGGSWEGSAQGSAKRHYAINKNRGFHGLRLVKPLARN